MIGIYFSGTGNTRHCVERLVRGLDASAESFPMEDDRAIEAILTSKTIVIGYPVQFSNLPIFVKTFLDDHKSLFFGKQIILVATMGLFSGDGTGCAARILKKFGAKISGGLHVVMPDNIGDNKMLKKSEKKNREIIAAANAKIDRAVIAMRNNRYPKEGLGVFYHLAGLFGQRLYFSRKTKHHYKKIKVDEERCIKCGRCAKACPAKNITVDGNGVVFHGRCTMCYRCFSLCPKQAVTILGKRVVTQYRFDDYEEKSES